MLLQLLLAAFVASAAAQAKQGAAFGRQMGEQNAQLVSPSYSLIHMDLSTGKDIGGCFERIAIGRRLAVVSISVPLTMLTSCEKKCFENTDCRAFSFGMGRHGNGTCEMQVGGASERGGRGRGRITRKLEPTQQPEDPDYDLFERKMECDMPTPTQQPPLVEGDNQMPPFLSQIDNNNRPGGPNGQGGQSGGQGGQTSSTKGCFRRLFAGKKVSPHSIRRSMPVVSAQDCEQACLSERQFICEGFNLRVDYRGLGRGSCELTDVPAKVLGDSLLKNFVEDQEFDFFERQGGGLPQCGPASSSGHSSTPSSTFTPSYGPHQQGGSHQGGYPQQGGHQSQRPEPPYPFGPSKETNYGGGGSYGGQGGGGNSGNYGGGSSGSSSGNYGGGGSGGNNYGGGGSGGNYGSGGNSGNYGGGGGSSGSYGGGNTGNGNYGGGGGGGPGGYGDGGNSGNKNGNWQLFSSSSQFGNNNQGYRPGPGGYNPPPGGYNPPPGGPPPNKGGWSNNHNSGVGFYGEAGQGFKGDGGQFNRPLPPLLPPNGPPPPPHGPSGPPIPHGPPPPHGPIGPPPPNGFPPPPSPGGGGPWGPNDDECFARVWSGQRLDKLAVRFGSNHPSLGGCQLECLQARDFVCHAFSYRHGPPGVPHGGPGESSCLLTDRPLQELHPREGLVPDFDSEIYERILGGRGCEHIAPYPPSTPWQQQPHGNGVRDLDPLPPLLTRPLPNINERPNLSPVPPKDCYAEYWPSARLSANAVTVATHAPTLPECLSRCTNSQQQWKTPCRSLAFRSGVHGHNCLLSELAQRDLRPNMDFLHDEEKSVGENWRLMAWDWSDERCRLQPPTISSGGGFNGLAPYSPQGDRDANKWSNGAGYGGGGGGGGGWGSSGGSSGSSYGSGGSGGFYPENNNYNNMIGGGGNGGGGGGGGGAMAFTVSGKPCARGHVCRMDPKAEFWSCPMDPGSGKDWDYCCSPTHRCGYSEGMQMPWCYVGMTKLQWRPCSERYWPYQNSRMDDREGRFLPVAYLHKSGPPGQINSTKYNFDRTRPNFVTNATTTLAPSTTTEKKEDELKDESSEMIPVNLTVVHSEV